MPINGTYPISNSFPLLPLVRAATQLQVSGVVAVENRVIATPPDGTLLVLSPGSFSVSVNPSMMDAGDIALAISEAGGGITCTLDRNGYLRIRGANIAAGNADLLFALGLGETNSLDYSQAENSMYFPALQ